MTRKPLEDIKTMNGFFPAVEAEALGMGDIKTRTEHLVLAALDLPDGSARRAFARLGADPDLFRPAIIEQHQRSFRSVGAGNLGPIADDHPIPPGPSHVPASSSPSARKLFKEVVRLIHKDKSRYSERTSSSSLPNRSTERPRGRCE